MRLRICPQAAQHEGGKFLCPETLLAELQFMLGAHVALEARGRQLRMGQQPVLRRAPHQQRAVLCIAHCRRRQHLAQTVGDQPRPLIGEHGHQRIGRA